MSDFLDSLLAQKEKSIITTFNLDKDVYDQMKAFCKANRISKSQFVREAIKAAMIRVNTADDRGYIYLIHVPVLKAYKIGKTRNLEQRINIDFGGAKITSNLEIVHTFKTNNMNVTEKLLHKHFKHKQREDTEFFDLDAYDVEWFKKNRYHSIPEIERNLAV